MSSYSRTIRTSATGAAAPALEIFAGSKPCTLRELGIVLVNATASVFALGYPAAKGLVPTTPVSFLPLSGGDQAGSLTTMAVAWGTPPTIPAAFFRQFSLPATVGASLSPSLTFGSGIEGSVKGGLVIPANKSLILWTITTVSIADVYLTIVE